MLKLHVQLENVLKVRINSNSEIILGLMKLSKSGKLDKPKELAMFAIILDRLGKMEDEALIEESLKNDNIVDLAKEEPELTLSSSEEEIIQEIDNKVKAKDAFIESIADNTVIPEATTSPDAPTEPETTEPVQTPVEAIPEEPKTETPVDDEAVDDGTISEFTPENIAGSPTPQVEPPTSS